MRNLAKRTSLGFILPVWMGLAAATAADASEAASCDQIRAEIMAHTGIPDRPNTELLRKVGANGSCRFTSAEAYRAAWADKPLPPPTRHSERRRHHEHDEDD
jgi:hypothetical protein